MNKLIDNKQNNKKSKYSNHHSKASLHKPVRNYVKSYINHIIHNKELLEEYYFPRHSSDTYTWWDCKPYKPKVFV
jgi:hypothetical protein